MSISLIRAARCDECGAVLDYEVGSIRWRCAGQQHLCIECEATKTVAEIVQLFRQRLLAAKKGGTT